jgi:hypothetical protein
MSAGAIGLSEARCGLLRHGAAQTVSAGTIINAHLDDSCRRGGGRALDAPAAHASSELREEERILSGKNKIHLERFFIICASKIGRGI